MKELTREKLNEVLEEHKHWINEDCENWEEMKADLRGADLRDANLRNTCLRGADLRGADLLNADFRGADLYDACLRGADFRGANLLNANLRGADLRGADFRGADLRGADLRNADLSGANNIPYIPMACPEEGDFIGWKKAESNKDKVIVKLCVPSDAKRSSATTRMCRCDKAKVLEIYNLDGTVAEERKCHSAYDENFIYEVGKTVEVTDFNENRWCECSQGIHFFMSRQEAISY